MSDLNTKVVTGKVRFSYCNVFEPVASEEGKAPKYSVSVLIPKSDTKTISAIEKAVENAKQVGKSKIADKSGKIPSNIKTPLRDGDEDRPDDPAYAGMMFLSATSSRKPTIVDKNLNQIMTMDEFYSGCYGRVSLNFYAYNVSSKGIAAGLQNLQKLEDGDPLTGGSTAQDDFGGENKWGDDDDDLL